MSGSNDTSNTIANNEQLTVERVRYERERQNQLELLNNRLYEHIVNGASFTKSDARRLTFSIKTLGEKIEEIQKLETVETVEMLGLFYTDDDLETKHCFSNQQNLHHFFDDVYKSTEKNTQVVNVWNISSDNEMVDPDDFDQNDPSSIKSFEQRYMEIQNQRPKSLLLFSVIGSEHREEITKFIEKITKEGNQDASTS